MYLIGYFALGSLTSHSAKNTILVHTIIYSLFYLLIIAYLTATLWFSKNNLSIENTYLKLVTLSVIPLITPASYLHLIYWLLKASTDRKSLIFSVLLNRFSKFHYPHKPSSSVPWKSDISSTYGRFLLLSLFMELLWMQDVLVTIKLPWVTISRWGRLGRAQDVFVWISPNYCSGSCEN